MVAVARRPTGILRLPGGWLTCTVALPCSVSFHPMRYCAADENRSHVALDTLQKAIAATAADLPVPLQRCGE
jgi:hypothetical protein